MAPSQKRKRKPLPKRPCPCCGSILSEKTIERHASGTHVPTRINVTIAAAAQKRANFELSKDVFSDLSGDSSDLDSQDLNTDPVHFHEPGVAMPDDEDRYAVDEDPLGFDGIDVEARRLEDIIQNTWSHRSRVDDYDSDDSESEDEDEECRDFEGNANASDEDSDIEGEGMRNGLGMNDLVEEDLQRIIAEFSTPFTFPFSFS